MAKETKANKEKNKLTEKIIDIIKKTSTTKKASTAKKKTTTKKSDDTKKKVASKSKKAVAEKETLPVKKSTAAAKKASPKKTTSAPKKSASKKVSAPKKSDVEEKEVTTKKAATTRKTTTAKVSNKKTATTKKTTSKKASTKEVSDSNVVASKKASTKKKSTTTAKTKTTSKKTATKKATASKKTASKKAAKSSKASATTEFLPEYYDLPYSYNKTTVKILAQTPKMLFVYWEISEDDQKRFKELYGENFFEETRPILIVYNNTMNYSFEVEINDFANSWYIHINDSKNDYSVELGRKPLPTANRATNEIHTQYIPYYVYISSSNQLEVPNNRVLLDFYKERSSVTFRNVKTGEIIEKDINKFKFVTNLGIMTIAQLYKYLYPNENFEYENFVGNPSSGLRSSGGINSSSFK